MNDHSPAREVIGFPGAVRKERANMTAIPFPELICIGTALVDSIIRGFDPEPVSASGFLAQSGTLSVGGEAVNAVNVKPCAMH